MLSLHPVSPEMGRHYYKEENYYSQKRAGHHSEWQGQGARELGLSGAVDGETFQRLLCGVRPTKDEPLRLSAHGAQQRAGIDLTFSAPKSVSLAALVAGDTRLEQAHRIAVSRAITLAEERYSKTRVGSSTARSLETTGNLTVAMFHHDTSRAKDPQLHTHCVVLNTVQRSDGLWRSLTNEDFYRYSKLLGLFYQNELARKVQLLGYGIVPQSNGTFEIEGYCQTHLRAFSKRREQIENLGATNQKEARLLVLKNRPTKGSAVSRQDLQYEWKNAVKKLGIHHPQARKESRVVEYVDARNILTSAMSHASEKDVAFRREDLEAFALQSSIGRLYWGSFQESIRGAETFRQLIKVTGGRYTTQEALGIEREMIARLTAGKKSMPPMCSTIPEDIKDNTLGLSLGQKEALEMSISSEDRYTAWQGVAGAGKTFAMKKLLDVARRESISIRGFAPSAEAAKVLETESGIPSDTVASLLHSPPPSQRTAGKELWIVDEASLLSARQCADLMRRAEAAGSRVILVGDTRQLSSVEAGNPFKLLQKHGITTAHLNESRRQKDSVLKAAAAAMAQGEMAEGLDILTKPIHGRSMITEITSESQRLKHMARTYVALPAEERSRSLVLAGTNKTRESLTALVRRGLVDQGSLSKEGVVTCLAPKDLTREETKAGLKVEPGNILVVHREDRKVGLRVGDQVVVTHVDRLTRIIYGENTSGRRIVLPVQAEPIFTVYEVKDRSFAVGDKVRWTRNDRKLGLRNGQELTVVGLSGAEVVVQSQEGVSHQIKKSSRPFLDHNYVNTVYAAQGKTCDQVLIAADKTFGKEATYVAVTRARERVALFTPSLEAAKRLAEHTRAKQSASELVRLDTTVSGRNCDETVKQQSVAPQSLRGLGMG